MASPFSSEDKAKIISAIKDDGLSIAEAEKMFNVTDDTIRKWLRESNGAQQSQSLTSENQILRRKVAVLSEIVTELLIEKKLGQTKSGSRT